jgi:hypothetical protein
VGRPAKGLGALPRVLGLPDGEGAASGGLPGRNTKQAPNTKRAPNQIRSTEIQNTRGLAETLFACGCISRVRTVATTASGLFWSLEFRILNLFGIWNLVLGNSSEEVCSH